MRALLAFVVATALLSGTAAAQQDPEPTPPRRPNILVILADDLGQGDLGCYNPDSRIPTPHLDALAASGLRFTDAHSPSAVCTPTRYGLLTGRYAWRTRLQRGVLNGRSRALLAPDRPTFASRLRDTAGYRTAAFGKWHLGLGRYDPDHPARHTDYAVPLDAGPHTAGFTTSLMIPASLDMAPYLWLRDGEVVEQPTAHTPGSRRRWSGGGGFWRAGPKAPSFDFDAVQPTIVAAAADFLRGLPRGPAVRPFCCYVPLAAPHTPWMPTAEFRGRSGAGWYGDFVAQVDAGLGRILSALYESGRADDTLVVFTSDNGAHWRPQDVARFEHAANGPWRGMKADAWEGGHRVPLLVRWPGHVGPGSRSDALVGLVDLYATLTAAAGLTLGPGEGADSRSLLPLWRGDAQAVRDELVCHAVDGTFVLRDGPWKLIDGLGSRGFSTPRRVAPEEGGPAGQLYHLGRDPGETQNQWLEEPERVAKMRARLDELRAAGRSVDR